MKKGIEINPKIINNQLIDQKINHPFLDITDSLRLIGITYSAYERSRRNGRYSHKMLHKLADAWYVLPDNVLKIIYPAINSSC